MKKVNLTFVTILTGTCFSILFSSCGNNSSDKQASQTDTVLSDAKRIDSLTTEKRGTIDFKFSTAEVNLPSPFEIVDDLYSNEAPFKNELLNPYENSSKYIKAFKKEINFGIYGIDLAYINFYGQNQATINYYSTIQSIAQDLNIDQVFNLYADRYRSNSSNHDSVVAIVDNIFTETDSYLRKNDRYLVASHVMAGAMIEVNYLSLSLLKDIKKSSASDALYEKVYNENRGIYHLINLFEEYTDKDSKDLLAEMKEYKKSYDSMIKSPADLTSANVDKAVALLSKVRNKLIQ